MEVSTSEDAHVPVKNLEPVQRQQMILGGYSAREELYWA